MYATKATILHFLQFTTAKSWGTDGLMVLQQVGWPVALGPHSSCAYAIGTRFCEVWGHWCRKKLPTQPHLGQVTGIKNQNPSHGDFKLDVETVTNR